MRVSEQQNVRLEYWTADDGKRARGLAPKGQREISESQVALYQAYYDTGRWFPESATPATWMDDGSFGNGNNRAAFISRLPEGVEVPILVAYNQPVSSLEYIDSGRVRRLGHQLHYGFPEWSERTCHAIASMVQILMTYRGPKALPKVDVKPDTAEAVRFAHANGERLRRAEYAASRIVAAESKVEGGIMTARTLGVVLFWLDDEDAVRFFQGMAVRSIGGADDPRNALLMHYRRPENVLPRGSQGSVITLRRIADLLGCWYASRRSSKWRPWTGDAGDFTHPEVEHSQERAA